MVEIRGEIYLTAAEFERINAERAAAGEELYANPRNLAAGTIKQLDSDEVARRKLAIVLYSLGYCEPEVVGSQSDLQERLRAWGLPVVEKYWTVRGIDEAWAAIGELDALRRSFAYGTDGAVVKLDELRAAARGGRDRQGAALGDRIQVQGGCRAETRLRAITIQVGKTGILSPVAELEPVFLSLSTISRATLHNEDEIRRKDIRVGDLVEIERAGEVIPAVLRSFPEERPAGAREFDLFEAVGGKCPVCGARIARVEVAAEGAKGVAWKCQNYDCQAQVGWAGWRHFAAAAPWRSTDWGRPSPQNSSNSIWCGIRPIFTTCRGRPWRPSISARRRSPGCLERRTPRRLSLPARRLGRCRWKSGSTR